MRSRHSGGSRATRANAWSSRSHPFCGVRRPAAATTGASSAEGPLGEAARPVAVVERAHADAGRQDEERVLAAADDAEDLDLATLSEVPGEAERRADRATHPPGVQEENAHGPIGREGAAVAALGAARAPPREHPQRDPVRGD